MDNQRKNHKGEKVEEDARRTAEEITEQSKQAFDRAGAMTSEAAEVIRASCSKVVKGAQEYHARVLEFTQANAKPFVRIRSKTAEREVPERIFRTLGGPYAAALGGSG